jgi:ribosomal protein S27AE
MVAVGDLNRNRQKLLYKTEAAGTDRHQRVWVARCMRSRNGDVCAFTYGVNGSDFFERRCPNCHDGVTGISINLPIQSHNDLLRAIQRLHAEKKNDKDVWLRWLSKYPNQNRSAEFIYNALNHPGMMIWLAGAAGIDRRLIREAVDAIDDTTTRMTQAATIRRYLPWVLIASCLDAATGSDALNNFIVSDLEEISNSMEKETTKQIQIAARLGQGQFRADVAKRWDNQCAVTGCSITPLLRASHIKPWRESSNRDRLNASNGIFLAAHVDALFDCGLVSFADDGTMLVSAQIANDIKQFNLPNRLRCVPTKDQKRFLAYHRRYVFAA